MLRDSFRSRAISLIDLPWKSAQPYPTDRLHNQHLELGPLSNQEACADPYPRDPDWMKITPVAGSLFHERTHPVVLPSSICARAVPLLPGRPRLR